jgi:two-component system response regulator AtoC
MSCAFELAPRKLWPPPCCKTSGNRLSLRRGNVFGGRVQKKDLVVMGLDNSSVIRGLVEKFVVGSQNPAMRAVDRIVSDIAPTQIPVLILGESGTGKEVMALYIHERSAHRAEPFSKMVCSTMEAETFDEFLEQEDGGNGSGLNLAGPGTLFLDEIGELEAAYQAKLLHVLADGDAVPSERCLRARVMSASRSDLGDQIRSGRFREDLYYRLNEVCLRLPPLRHRKEDIAELADFFLERHALRLARPKPSVTARALGRLLDYAWPGNIRQLENTMKKLVAVGDEELALSDLGSLAVQPSFPQAGGDESVSLKQAARAASQHAERELILRTLERTRWNRKRAARELQISYKALLYKLKQIGLDDALAASHPAGEH